MVQEEWILPLVPSDSGRSVVSSSRTDSVVPGTDPCFSAPPLVLVFLMPITFVSRPINQQLTGAGSIVHSTHWPRQRHKYHGMWDSQRPLGAGTLSTSPFYRWGWITKPRGHVKSRLTSLSSKLLSYRMPSQVLREEPEFPPLLEIRKMFSINEYLKLWWWLRKAEKHSTPSYRLKYPS